MDSILFCLLTGLTGFYFRGFPDESLETPIALGDKKN